jgi:hypothetical protein
MEIILAVVVATAVIFFGALISAGNERQRKAIDGLHEQVVLWAVQDLRIKRERLARDVRVDDPIYWLNNLATKAYSHNLSLHIIEAFDEPKALVCRGDANCNMVFSPISPYEIRQINQHKRNKLAQYVDRNPLMNLPRKVAAHEFSVLNTGILFDLELSLVWKELTGQDMGQTKSLWLYSWV